MDPFHPPSSHSPYDTRTHIYTYIKNYNYASDHRQKDGFDTAKTTVNIVDGEYSTNIAKKRGQVGVFEGQNEEEEEEEELVRG